MPAHPEEFSVDEFTSSETSPHAAKIISSGKAALFGRVCDDIAVANVSHLDEARRGADSAIDTLVVSYPTALATHEEWDCFHSTFKNQRDSGHKINKNQQCLARHMPPNLRYCHCF